MAKHFEECMKYGQPRGDYQSVICDCKERKVLAYHARTAHCSKRGYPDRIGALLALAKTGQKHHTRRPKDEKRAYLCPTCKKWHLSAIATWAER